MILLKAFKRGQMIDRMLNTHLWVCKVPLLHAPAWLMIARVPVSGGHEPFVWSLSLCFHC